MSEERKGPPVPSRAAWRLHNDMMAGTVKSPDYPENIYRAAAARTARLQSELDITNADNIALWLEANMADSSLAWLACRIVEAHEASTPPPPSLHPEPIEADREAEIAAALMHHSLGGPWAQYRQDFKFAANCGCGKTFFGQTALEARTSWAAHVAAAFSTPDKGDPD